MALKPVLKWVGGKRKLSKKIIDIIMNDMSFDIENATYFEPFLGGGAVFFEMISNHIGCKKAVLSDLNSDLITTMNQIIDNPTELVDQFYRHVSYFYEQEDAYFYEIREQDRYEGWANECDIKKAARMLFLNRFAFNGVYRVNQKGFFNVPLGKNNYKSEFESISPLNKTYFNNISKIFKSRDIAFYNDDYRKVLEKAVSGDVVYFDPPYMPISSTSDFTSYTKYGFSYQNQLDLINLANELCNRGIGVIISNSSNEELKNVYQSSGFNIKTVEMQRSINSNISKRNKVKEYIYYKIPKNIKKNDLRINYLDKKIPQADDFEGKICALILKFYDFFKENKKLLTKSEIKDFIVEKYNYKKFEDRQVDYYCDAIYFLDLIKFVKNPVYDILICNEINDVVKNNKIDRDFLTNLIINKMKFYGDINIYTNEIELKKILSDYISSESTLDRRVSSLMKWFEYMRK